MKRLFSFLFALSLFLFTQCTREVEGNSPQKEEDTKVFVSFTNQGDVKTSVDESGKKLTFKWASTDVIHVFDGSKYCGPLTLDSGEGKTTGTFSGEISLPSGSNIYFFYFGSEISAPTSGQSMNIDFFNQLGTLDYANSKLIAYCAGDYSKGKIEYIGQLQMLFSVGKFRFSHANPAIENGTYISAVGLNQSITISEGGEITYNSASAWNCAQFQYDAKKTDYYVVLPSSQSANSLSFWINNYNCYFDFTSEIQNGKFYSATQGAPIAVELVDHPCTVYYMMNDGSGTTFSTENVPETTHDIITSEPTGTGRFSGWSLDPYDTKGRYASSQTTVSGEFLHSINVAKKESITFYALWDKCRYPDFSNYCIGNFYPDHFTVITTDNNHIQFSNDADNGYERMSIPIENLEIGKWYRLEFTEKMTKPDGASYSWWNENTSGIYATTVRPNIASSESGCNTMLTVSQKSDWNGVSLTTESDATPCESFVWTYNEGDWTNYNDAGSTADIVFKATSTTMHWVWESSKQIDNQKLTYKYSFVSLKQIPDPSGPTIVFNEATLHGYHFKPSGSDESKIHSESAYKFKYGYSSYKVNARNTNDNTTSSNINIEYHTIGTKSYEKVNIPIVNLTVGKTYNLKYSYELTNYEQASLLGSLDLCYGIVNSRNIKTSSGDFNNTSNVSWGKYWPNNTNETYDVDVTFEAISNTMYLVFSTSKLHDFVRYKVILRNASITQTN